jgi:choice-of-anchor C domain-containing protein
MSKTLLLAAALVGFAGAAVADPLVTNGSFETNIVSGTGTGSQGYYNVVTGDTTSIADWTVGGRQGVDLIDTYWKAADGTWSVDMNGFDQGSLSQTLTTQVGHSYVITFDLAANPGINLALLQVTAAGYSGIYSFNSLLNPPTPTLGYIDGTLAWTAESFFFIANSTQTLLTFDSLIFGSAAGPALDNVAGSDIPEPASAALLIAGLTVIGVARRRRAR